MKTFTSMTRQNCARWIFIFGVLAGLFFSRGEGIQLLPFPGAEGHYSKNTFSVLENNSKSYAFSVHGSGSLSTLLKSKYQKNTNQHLPGEYLTLERLDLGVKYCSRAAQNRQKTSLLHGSLVLSSQSDRAPPAV